MCVNCRLFYGLIYDFFSKGALGQYIIIIIIIALAMCVTIIIVIIIICAYIWNFGYSTAQFSIADSMWF